MSWHDEPDTVAIVNRVDAAWRAMREAEKKFNRSKKPEVLELARAAMVSTEAAYRQVANERDEFMAIRIAQRAQGKLSPITLTPKLFPGAPERDGKS